MADFSISALPSETLTSDTLLLGSMPDGLGGYDSGKFEAQEISGIVVKRMAQADYDNLTPAEKNNGTLYITDGTPPSETITGSDVLYFSDVSDSNKPKSTTAAAVAGLAVDTIDTRLGNRLVGDWTASTSTANLQALTDWINVDKGTYLIVLQYPDVSLTTFVGALYAESTSNIYDNQYIFGGSCASKCILTIFSSATRVRICSAQSATCNFTNLARGSIRAIKLSSDT